MALKDLFPGTSKTEKTEQAGPPKPLPDTAAPADQKVGRVETLSLLLKKEKPPKVELGEREKAEFVLTLPATLPQSP